MKKKKYLKGINFDDFELGGLGQVSAEIETLTQQYEDNIDEILNQIEKGFVKFSKEVISFEENDLLYNKGITETDKQAWVFFQKKYRNIPMTGWEKYFIKDNQSEIDRLVLAKSLFYSGGKYYPISMYTWGNIYERIELLMQDEEYIVSKYNQEVFNNHKEVLEKVKPKMLRIDNPIESERPFISAVSKLAYEKNIFAVTDIKAEWSDVANTEQLNAQGERLAKKKRVDLYFDGVEKYSMQEIFSKWLYAIDRKRYYENASNVGPFEVVNYFLLGNPISGRDKDLPAIDQQQKKQKAREEGEKLFAMFINEVLLPEDIDRLNFIFNKRFNGWSDLQYSSIPIGLSTTSQFLGHGFAIRPEKREAIAYMSAVGSGILAYDVGVGKTISALLELASSLQSGKCTRALLVVPNPTYKNWIREAFGGYDDESGETFNGILSGTGITLNDWYNLGGNIPEKLGESLTKKVAEKSITILTYEGFKLLGLSKENASDFIEEFSEIVSQNEIDPDSLTTATEEDVLMGLGKSARDQAKQTEKTKEKIGEGLLKNTIADFDILGFDYIVIDEAHRCKNIFEGVKSDAKTGKKEYNLTGVQSATGIKAFFLCNYVQRVAAPKKGNIMLLTATPFTNSPLEVYSMTSLVGYDHMIDSGLYNINDFFKMFVAPLPEYVVKYDGTVTIKETIKSYTNRIILQKLIFTKINYKSGDDLVPPLKRPIKVNLPLVAENINGQPVKLPKEKQVLTYLRMNEMQADNQLAINQALSNITRDNFSDLLKYLGASQDNALSPYLYKLGNEETPSGPREFVANSPKILYAVKCIESVKKYHESKGTPISGQVIYSDRGVDYFPMIKQYLLEISGFKKNVQFEGTRLDEVMIIASGGKMEKTDKETIKEAFLKGVVKVIIGSSTIREGINLQTYGTVIYDLRPDWNPTDFRQLEGRIWRQKNKFGYVRIVMPLVENSMDVFMFQKLEEKTARINDLFYREGSSNMLDLSSLDPGEIKYALIADIGSLAKIDFNIEYSKAVRSVNILKDDLLAVKELERELGYYRTSKNDFIDSLKNDIITMGSIIDIMESTLKKTEVTPENKKEVADAKKSLEFYIKFKFEAETAANSLLDEAITGLKSRYNRVGSITPSSLRWNYQLRGEWRLSSFIDRYKTIIRKEKSILRPKGYSINDSVAVVSAEIQKELDELLGTFKLQYGVRDPETNEFELLNASQYERVNELALKPKRYLEIYDFIETKKKELNIIGASVEDRVKEFTRLNYLLDYKMSDVDPKVTKLPEQGQKAPQSIQCPPMDSNGVRRIDKEGLEMLENCIAQQKSTKELNTDSQGNYTPERLLLHERLISDFKSQLPCIKHEKPICILTGGAPGSGKSTFLKKYAPWIASGNLLHIDADEVRAKLPEYEGWNAANTHEETSELVKRMLAEIGEPCNFDMIYDGTMNKAANYKPLIKQLKELGFIVFVIYIEVPQEVSIERAMTRYQKSGRYVPLHVINDIYSKGLEAFNEVIKMVDGHIRVDGISGKITSKAGFQLPSDRNYNFENDVEIETIPAPKPKANLAMIKIKAKAAKAKLLLLSNQNKAAALSGKSSGYDYTDSVDFDNLSDVLEHITKDGNLVRVYNEYAENTDPHQYYNGFDKQKAAEEFNFNKDRRVGDGDTIENVYFDSYSVRYNKNKYNQLQTINEQQFDKLNIYDVDDLAKYIELEIYDVDESIDSYEIRRINDSSNDLLEDVSTELKGELPETFEVYGHKIYADYGGKVYFTKYDKIYFYADKDHEIEIGKLQLRIADHSYNPRNNSIDWDKEAFVSIVIANKDATKDKFHGKYNLYFDSDNTVQDVAEELTDYIQNVLENDWDIEKIIKDNSLSGYKNKLIVNVIEEHYNYLNGTKSNIADNYFKNPKIYLQEVDVILKPSDVEHNNIKLIKEKGINSSKMIHKLFLEIFSDDTKAMREEMYVIYFDRQLKPIGWNLHTIGARSASIVDPVLIMGAGLKIAASSFAMAHNHPSGNMKPSDADFNITKKMVSAGEFLDMPLIDHIIMSGRNSEEYYSFADNGRI